MRQMEMILVLGTLSLISGCTKDFTFEEVVGRYQTRAYPCLELAIVVLNSDSTYEQVFVYENRDVLRNTGTWQYHHSKGLGTWASLKDAIVMRIGRDSRSVFPDTVETYGLSFTSHPFSNGITIEVDPDFGITYYKVEAEGDDD